MRVATLNTSQIAFAGIEARQNEQARLQQQLSTSLRVNSPGDDPVAAAQAELARSRLARVAQDQRSGQLATSLLSAADGALSQGIDLLQSARENLVAAGDGGYSLSDRKALALELRSARDSMLALVNTRDGAGGFVFAGQGSADEPFSGTGTPSYAAAAGVQRMGEGGRFTATVDGRSSFMTLPQGNGVFVTASGAANTGAAWMDSGSVSQPGQLTGHDYRITVGGTPGALTYSVDDLTAGTQLVAGAPYLAGTAIELDGQKVKISGTPATGDSFEIKPAGQQSIFTTLDEAIAVLESDSTAPMYSEKLQRVQASLDRALDSMILVRSGVGEELRKVDDAASTGDLEKLLTTQRRSDLEDLDYAAGISQLATSQTAMEAALKSYASVARTSLFQLLG